MLAPNMSASRVLASEALVTESTHCYFGVHHPVQLELSSRAEAFVASSLATRLPRTTLGLLAERLALSSEWSGV